MSAGDILKTDQAQEGNADAEYLMGDAPTEAEDLGADDRMEEQADDEWINASRSESTDELNTNRPERRANRGKNPAQDEGLSPSATEPSINRPQQGQKNDDALFTKRAGTLSKPGTEATSKLGKAMGATSKQIDDVGDHAPELSHDHLVGSAGPSPRRGDVAPYIEQAERELEEAKNPADSLDIFDRIAQAAESQYDESRGSTMQRVSELVDDRRVGTKRWSPSRTVRNRMEELEAARLASQAQPNSRTTEAKAEIAAPSSAETTEAQTPQDAPISEAAPQTPSPDAEPIVSRQVEPEIAEEAAFDDGHVTVETTNEATPSEDHEDDGSLRIIPGVRGRRRDRARKSRLDEDFEKIFDSEDGQPSIGSLRRKLRSESAKKNEDSDTDSASSADVSGNKNIYAEEHTETTSAGPVGKVKVAISGLLKRKSKPSNYSDEVESTKVSPIEKAKLMASGLLNRKPKATASETHALHDELPEDDDDAEAMAAAFETEDEDMRSEFDFTESEIQGDDWNLDDEDDRPVGNSKKTLLVGGGLAVAATGVGAMLYRTMLGG